jgi:hypothetical protein
MYFVNKETNLIHSYFRRDELDWADNGDVLWGKFYTACHKEFTFEDMQKKNFTEDWDVASKLKSDEVAMYDLYSGAPMQYVFSMDYTSWKLQRFFIGGRAQMGHDFSNNDLIELSCFAALLYRMVLTEKWEYIALEDWDKYGIVEKLSKEFYIVGDDREDIYNSKMLVED